MGQKIVLTGDDIARSIRRIAHEILESNLLPNQLVLLGIPTRGVTIAQRLARQLQEISGEQVSHGSLDITMYRDDLALRGRPIGDTVLPEPIDGKTVVLVDDVLFSGRSVRAALNSIADLGRPSRVKLVALIDRGHREFPIRADFVGKNLPTAASERVSVKLVENDGSDQVVISQ